MRGLPFARTEFEDLSLRRLVYQALLQRIGLGDRQLLAPTTAFVRQTYERHPDVAAIGEILQYLQAGRITIKN